MSDVAVFPTMLLSWLSRDTKSFFQRLPSQALYFALPVLGLALVAEAQTSVTVPIIAMAPTGMSTRPITPAEAAAHTHMTELEAHIKGVTYQTAHYPLDSIRTIVETGGRRWLARITTEPIQGIQLDAASRVGIAANQDRYAESQITTRLATPGLSFSDKAYTLRAAVEAFADVYVPARLTIAEQYLRALDALGDSAATWQFDAHKSLLWTYYLLGRSPDVVRHGIRAVQLTGIMAFAYRNMLFGQTEEQVYSPTVEALAGQPNGRAKIEQLNTLLRAAAVPSKALVASDSIYHRLGLLCQRAAENMIAGNAKLGMPAAPLVAQYWLNTAMHDSATLLLNDGKIRLIEIAHTGCIPCVQELHALERVRRQFPSVEPVLSTWTFGYWGNRIVEPSEEIRHLADYFVSQTKVTFPIGIWAGKKIPNADGGLTPEESPNIANYPLFGKPMLWIVDGHGHIRRVFTGYSREIEEQITRTVEFLLRERANVPRPATAG